MMKKESAIFGVCASPAIIVFSAVLSEVLYSIYPTSTLLCLFYYFGRFVLYTMAYLFFVLLITLIYVVLWHDLYKSIKGNRDIHL